MLKKNNKKHTFLNSDWGRITFSPQTQISNPIKGHLQGTYTVSRGDSHVIIFLAVQDSSIGGLVTHSLINTPFDFRA